MRSQHLTYIQPPQDDLLRRQENISDLTRSRFGQRLPKKSIDNLREVFLGFSYKPGWSLSLKDIDSEHACLLQIHARIPDVKNPTVMIPLTANYFLDLWHCCNVEYLMQAIYDFLLNLEKHEIDEWLKFNGKNLHDPHPSEL